MNSDGPGKMDWREVDTENCPVAGAMKVLGDKWTLLIIRDAFNGIRRFEDFRTHLDIPRALLSRRLSALVDQEILRREVYRETGKRARHQYVLTSKGLGLRNILIALKEWGNEHVNAAGDYPLELVDRQTGDAVRLSLVRESDEKPVNPRNLELRPGPGLRLKAANTRS